MILLDTHIWVWWVHGARLSEDQLAQIASLAPTGLGVSIISCWEVAKLVEKGRLTLQQPVSTWFEQALSYPGVQLLDLSVPIVLDATSLPGEFHNDPADQLIVATARIHRCQLATADGKLLSYEHVDSLDFSR